MAKTGKNIQICICQKDSSNNEVEVWYTIPEHDDPQEQKEQIKRQILKVKGLITLGES